MWNNAIPDSQPSSERLGRGRSRPPRGTHLVQPGVIRRGIGIPGLFSLIFGVLPTP